MFYLDHIENDNLRFGDVLTWGLLPAPFVEKKEKADIKLDITQSTFSIVLTPCCSIDNSNVCLSPLIEVLPSFYDNPYFVSDLTRINRKMNPQDSVSHERWERFGEEVQNRRLEEGFGYGLLEFFIYENNDLFPEYTVNRRTGDNIETKYYMIDFRNVYKINSETLKSPQNTLLKSKILQLTPKTREDLRLKMAHYYGKPAKEDEPPLRS